MSAPNSNQDKTQNVVGEGNLVQNPPLGENQDDGNVENVAEVIPPDNEMGSVQGDESLDKEVAGLQGDESMDKEVVGLQGDESMDKEVVGLQGDESMDKEVIRLQVDESMDKEVIRLQGDESMDKEVIRLQGDESTDNEMAANLGLARTRMLNLELGSPGDVTGSTCSTAGTDKTPTLSTTSISPEGATVSSGSGDSKYPDSSVGTTPLDSPQMIQAILARRSSDTPSILLPSESSSAIAQIITRGAQASESDTSPSPTVESGVAGKRKHKESVFMKVEGSSPVGGKSIQTPASTPDTKLSPAASVQPSRQSSLEQTDSSMSPSGSRDTETDNADADVSSISPMSLEKKRKVLKSRGPQHPPPMYEVLDDFFDPAQFPIKHDRSDTLDDADTLTYDSRSVRSSIPERGASVIFPSGKSVPIPPDRDRRAISLPAGPDEKDKPPVVQRRAISEIPDDSSSNSDLPPPTASPDDVSLPPSPNRERRAVSLPPGRAENVTSAVRDQRRALSEVPENLRSAYMLPNASPDDVPLPPSLVSSSSSSSQHASDVSLDRCRDQSNDPKNKSSESSLPTEDVDAMMPHLQGWCSQGAFKDGRHLTEDQPGPSKTTEKSVQPVSEKGMEARLSKSSSKEDVQSSLVSSSISSSQDVSKDTSSDPKNGKSSESSLPTEEVNAIMPGLQGWLDKGDFTDGRHLTSGQGGPNPSLPTEVDSTMPEFQGRLDKGAIKEGTHPKSCQAGPSRTTEKTKVQPDSAKETKACSSESSSRGDSFIPSSLSEPTCSDIGGFLPWLTKGAYKDDRHLTTEQQPKAPVKSAGGKVKTESGSSSEKAPLQSTSGSRLAIPTDVKEGSPSSSEMDVEPPQEKVQQSEDSSKDLDPHPHSSRNFPRRAKKKSTIEVLRTPKRKRDVRKSIDSADAGSSSSDPKSNVPVSPEDDMATKKYCSEFSRPITRQLTRCHSTGSVREADIEKRDLKELKKESKETESSDEDSEK